MHQYLIDKIKEGRKNKGLKQSDVFELTGIKPNTISNYENGVSEPDIDTYLLLCKIYDLDYSNILETAYNLKSYSNVIHLDGNEQEHIKKYRSLNNDGKEIVDMILNREYQFLEYRKKMEDIKND